MTRIELARRLCALAATSGVVVVVGAVSGPVIVACGCCPSVDPHAPTFQVTAKGRCIGAISAETSTTCKVSSSSCGSATIDLVTNPDETDAGPVCDVVIMLDDGTVIQTSVTWGRGDCCAWQLEPPTLLIE